MSGDSAIALIVALRTRVSHRTGRGQRMRPLRNERTCSRCVTRRKFGTPGIAEEHKRQETPTINAIDRQPTNLTDQAPSTIERAACSCCNAGRRARCTARSRRLHVPYLRQVVNDAGMHMRDICDACE